MDDFGTGYSSLSQIATLPLDALKIDRAFISRMEEGADAMAIVSAMIRLAQALRISVVAEGVETERQESLLAGLGCDQAQGFLFGRPMTEQSIVGRLDRVAA
jgi:EAL domain-containing protein (putative c-di-GMP-specific phosphodiesterase class I)